MYRGNASQCRCPKCGGTAYRVPRRFIDKVLTLGRPVKRFRCREDQCDWVGNVPTAERSPTEKRGLLDQ